MSGEWSKLIQMNQIVLESQCHDSELAVNVSDSFKCYEVAGYL